MDLAVIIASFYMLFDFSGNYQSWLLRTMKKTPAPKEYYDSRKMLSEVLSLDKDIDLNQKEADGQESLLEELLDESQKDVVKEFIYRDSSEKLKLFEFGEEEFTSVSLDGKSYVSVNKDVFFLIKYDDFLRVSECIEWNNGKTLDSVKMQKRTVWFYETQGARKEEENFITGEKSIIYYDEFSRAVSMDVFVKEKKINTQKFSYDAEGRIIQEELIIFSESKNKYTGRDFSTRKKVFVFHEELPEPDLYFYEDGDLHLKRLYLSPDVYTEDLYFDGGFSVRVKYENGLKVKEQIFRGPVNEK